MHTLITAIAEVTPDWLTHVLRRSGALPTGKVRSVDVARVHDEQLHSISYFLHVTFSPDAPRDVPTRLFLKLPREADPADAVASSSGAREVRMYQALAPDAVALPVLPCYDAVYDMERRRYHSLLADLSETHEQPAWHLEIADHYVTRTIDCLARFHAYWWEHPRLNNGMGVLPRAETVAARIEAVRAAFPRFVDSLGARLAPEDRRGYEMVLAALPGLWAARTTMRRQTMLHGDAHFWNFLYPRDPANGTTYIVDWQNYGIGRGVTDVAYMLVLRYPHRTPDNEHALVRRYHAALLRGGVQNYDWDACWYDYRRAVAEQVVFALQAWAGGWPEVLWRLFVDRSLRAFQQLDCAEVLR